MPSAQGVRSRRLAMNDPTPGCGTHARRDAAATSPTQPRHTLNTHERASEDNPMPGQLARACERDSGGSIIWHCDRVTSSARSMPPACAMAKAPGHPGREGTRPTAGTRPGRRSSPGSSATSRWHAAWRAPHAPSRSQGPQTGSARSTLPATPASNLPAATLTRQRCHARPAGDIPGRPASTCQAGPAGSALRQEDAVAAYAREGPADLGHRRRGPADGCHGGPSRFHGGRSRPGRPAR